MNQQRKQAFTLVELIVVITILAILGTIAFISLQWYSRDSRDSVRISDVSNMKTSLELFHLDAGKYPLPDDAEEVTFSWWVLWYQGTFWEQVRKNVSRNMAEVPTDPLMDKEYIYSVLNNRNELEVLALLEWDVAAMNDTQVYAWNLVVTPRVDGNYNGLYVKTSDYIVPVPSILTAEDTTGWMELDANNIASQITHLGENIPVVWNVSSNTWALSGLKLSVYTGSITSESTDEEKVALMNALVWAYSGSTLDDSWLIKTVTSQSWTWAITSMIDSVVLGDSTNVGSSSSSSSSSTSSSSTGWPTVPSEGLIALYEFDGNSLDTSGSTTTYDATDTDIFYIDGKFWRAAKFPSGWTQSKINFPTLTDLSSTIWSISFWVYVTSHVTTQDYGNYLSMWSPTNVFHFTSNQWDHSAYGWATNAGKPGMAVNWESYTSGWNYADQLSVWWHHIWLVFWASDTKMYIDGTLSVTRAAVSNNLNASAMYFSQSGPDFYVDKMRIYDTELWEGDIDLLAAETYTAPTCNTWETETSWQCYDPYRTNVSTLITSEWGSITDNKWTCTFSLWTATTDDSVFGSYSIRNNVTNDTSYLQSCSNIDFGTWDYTEEFWTKSYASNIGQIYSSSHGHTVRQMSGITFYNSVATQTIWFGAWEWTHFAVTRESWTLRIFINWIMKAELVWDTENILWTNNPMIGWKTPWYSYYYQGYYDQVRLTKWVARYTENFTPPLLPFATQ